MAARKKNSRKAPTKKKSAARKNAGTKKSAKKAGSKKAALKKKGGSKKAVKKSARKKTSAKKSAKKAASKKSGGVSAATGRARQKLDRRGKLTVDLIVGSATDVHSSIGKKRKPDLHFPIRSLGNVTYSQKKGYFEIGKQKKTRTLTVNTVKSFAQTLRMMGLSKELVETNDFATKRDAYYQSKNWEEAKFDEQPESDTVMDDIEAMFSMRGVSREELRFVPDEHGGAVAGQLIVLDPDRDTGRVERIDCTRFGSGAYSIPSNVEHLSFETKAKFILAIETGGVFQRLQSHKFWQQRNCILVSMAGVPTRATRRFIRKLSDECKIPVYAFVDCDPYGISNIYRTLKVGSGERSAPLAVLLCAAGELPRRDAAGHHRLRTPDPPASGRRHQACEGRLEERSVLQGAQAVAAGDRATAEDGRACGAAGPREVGAQLRDRRVPAPETEEAERLPTLS